MKSISPSISEGLFVLIKSLKKSEKRNFKLFINKQTKENGINTYLRLFNAIEKQEIYNEELLIQKLKFTQRKLAYTKHLLYELVLKSLRHLYDEKSPDFKLRTLLANIEILYQKTLYRQSYKMLLKAKKLAFETENYNYLPDILSWSAQLFFHSPDKLEQHKAHHTMDDHQKIIHQLHQELVLKDIRDTMLGFQRKHYVANTPHERAKLKQLTNQAILHISPEKFTLQAKMAYFETMGVYFQLLNDPKNASIYYKQLVELWDNQHNFLLTLNTRYQQHLFTFLKLQMITHENLNLQYWLSRFDNIPVANAQEEIEKKTLIMSLKKLAQYLTNTHTPEPDTEMIKTLTGLPSACSFTLDYYLSLTYFSQKKLRKATVHLNNIFYHPHYNLLSYKQQGFIKILELMLHYDLGNLSNIDHLHKSVYRFIHKYRDEAGFERLVIKYLKKLYNASEKNELMLDLKKALQVFPKKAVPWQRFEFELLANWVDNKVLLYNGKKLV